MQLRLGSRLVGEGRRPALGLTRPWCPLPTEHPGREGGHQRRPQGGASGRAKSMSCTNKPARRHSPMRRLCGPTPQPTAQAARSSGRPHRQLREVEGRGSQKATQQQDTKRLWVEPAVGSSRETSVRYTPQGPSLCTEQSSVGTLVLHRPNCLVQGVGGEGGHL